MANNFHKAGDAIEAVVADIYPSDSGDWADIVPTSDDDWGMNLAVWAKTARRMIDKFNASIAPLAIKVPDSAIKNLGDGALIDFQGYLADKADNLIGLKAQG